MMSSNAMPVPVAYRLPSRLKRIKTSLIVVGILWTLESSLSVYPHGLSYFCEAAGGPAAGRSHLFHSAVDWGQDLMYLKRWMADHPEAHPLHLAYYGYYDPRDLGLSWRPIPDDVAMQTSDPRGERLDPGWYAVSATRLGGVTGRPFSPGSCSFLQHAQHVATAGYSIYIIHLASADVEHIQREMRLLSGCAAPSDGLPRSRRERGLHLDRRRAAPRHGIDHVLEQDCNW